MKEFILGFFGYVVFFYSAALVISYVAMIILSGLHLRKNNKSKFDPILKQNIQKSPYTPGVSIVAGAYNEEAVVVECVESFLRQDYPKFEVIIVNDGSKDKTLEKLIDHFELELVDYAYIERIQCRPFRGLYRSTNPKYSKLTVVDKENGGTKADAINGGLNVVQYPYFVNTDVDCILSHDAIFQCIRPILEQDDVIAVSGAMAMNNGCDIEHGEMTAKRVSKAPAPMFQSLEYLRSFIVGKMAWSQLNAMPNVSGGYGLFDTQTVINAGGYSPDSFAEDMDMLIRMITYKCDMKEPYRVVQIPDTCCWTQGPPNLKVLYKQRTRWGRGLIQTFVNYRSVLFNRTYRRLGLVTLPYVLIFEFLAPIIEMSGLLTTIYLAFTGGINWITAAIMLGAIVVFNYLLSMILCFYDFTQGITYGKRRSYFWLMGAAFFEPFLYHPLIVVFSLIGYWNFITSKRAVWGNMTRKSYSAGGNAEEAKPKSGTGGPDGGSPTPPSGGGEPPKPSKPSEPEPGDGGTDDSPIGLTPEFA